MDWHKKLLFTLSTVHPTAANPPEWSLLLCARFTPKICVKFFPLLLNNWQFKKMECILSGERSRKFAWDTKPSEQMVSGKFYGEFYNLIRGYDWQIRNNQAFDSNSYRTRTRLLYHWLLGIVSHQFLSLPLPESSRTSQHKLHFSDNMTAIDQCLEEWCVPIVRRKYVT